ncbi:MAG: sigma-70 family RNA polymerase sigma factor [Bacteroidales bacterium]|nr:sigma-70 family RNA polymerase sigma factor [Bacteroidales bacterium]
MKTQGRTDYELLSDYINGERAALEQLIKRYERKVYVYILMMVHQSHLAEDLTQDTFIKAIQSLKRGQYSDDNKFGSWLIRIAHNIVIDHFRRSKQRQELLSSSYDYDLFATARFSEANVEQRMVYGQVLADVRSLLNELPMEQREVVLLRYYGDLSFKEIADLTNVSINTALGRMRYAIMNMRKTIEANNISLPVSI